MLKRLFALWYGPRYMPREMRVYYYFNVALLALMSLFLLIFLLPLGNRTASGEPVTYLESVAFVVPILLTVILGILASCDSIVWKRSGSRTAFFLSTTSALFLLGNLLTFIGSLVGIYVGLTRVRRYMFYETEVDEYYGVSAQSKIEMDDA